MRNRSAAAIRVVIALWVPASMAGCGGVIVLPSPQDDVARRDIAWVPPDLAGIDCTMTTSAIIACTDVDTKIPYETGRLGCKFRHDRCADVVGDNFLWDRSKPAGSGQEPIIAGKRFDYWRKTKMSDAADIPRRGEDG